MDLGEKLRQARLEAGLSQRALCGSTITRNMLSQIENGSANPSMATLQYLAGQLGKPVSFFLEEDSVSSPNPPLMDAARKACKQGNFAGVLEILQGYQAPDPVFDSEKQLLSALAVMGQAQKQLALGKASAVQLPEQFPDTLYFTPALRREWLLLQGTLHPEQAVQLSRQLPSIDDELLLRAQAALSQQEFKRCRALLAAVEDPQSPLWHLLMGEALLGLQQYQVAAEHFRLAESRYPHRTAVCLEHCYRELEDFKQAYYYACKVRNLSAK